MKTKYSASFIVVGSVVVLGTAAQLSRSQAPPGLNLAMIVLGLCCFGYGLYLRMLWKKGIEATQ